MLGDIGFSIFNLQSIKVNLLKNLKSQRNEKIRNKKQKGSFGFCIQS